MSETAEDCHSIKAEAAHSIDETRSRYDRGSRIGYAFALLGIVAFWGATFPVVKNATRDLSVLGFLALRFAVAATALSPFAIGKLSKSKVHFKETVRLGAMMGVVFVSAYLLQTYGLQFTSSSNSGIITGMFIVFVPITGWLLYSTRTSLWLWLGIALSVAGLVILTDSVAAGLRRGDLLTLLCAVAFGLHITLLDRYAEKFDAVALSFVQLVFCAIVTGCCWPALEAVKMPSGAEWAAIVATALVGSALALWVQTKAQQRLPAVTIALIIMTEPVFAALFSQWLLDERLTAVQWGGAALMVTAMLVTGLIPSTSNDA